MVASANVLLKDRQEVNRLMYLRKNVLQAAGLVELDQRVSNQEALEIFRERIEPRLVELRSGEYVIDPDTVGFDQRAASSNPAQSRPAPDNPSGVRRIPHLAKVYLVKQGSGFSHVVLPVEGLGLYGMLFGFVALAEDTNSIQGISFYENRETPGLGGEVDDPRWKAGWVGRKAFGENWQPLIHLVKGPVGTPSEDPYRVDALSGATMTSNGVTQLLHFWLGEQGFGAYLHRIRQRGGF
jgi:Na+-transporting NADH:ubiquinone oxidoreductase subunit C